MLTTLEIENFALIENIKIEFEPGFNALTGETGAGKTVLIGAIGILLGDRADSIQVRKGSDSANLSCQFDLEMFPEARDKLVNAGFIHERENEITISRMIARQGKGKCSLNGRICSTSTLSEVGEMLVEIHGQSAHQLLLKSGMHIEYLDRFAGKEHLRLLEEYSRQYSKLKALERELKNITLTPERVEREREILAYAVSEIDRAAPKPGELEALEERGEILRNARDLVMRATAIQQLISGEESGYPSIRDLLLRVLEEMKKASEKDKWFEKIFEKSSSALFEFEEMSHELERYILESEGDTGDLEELEARITLLRELIRKYGTFGRSIEEVLSYRDEAAARLDRIERECLRLNALNTEINSQANLVVELARRLSENRKRAAGSFCLAVLEELKELELGGAQFDVSIRDRFSAGGNDSPGVEYCGPLGFDSVEFLFCPEHDGDLAPLRKIASGGEMSRVMLALKIVLAGSDHIPVLIFDEVDAGIGGETAGKVGEKIHKLSSYHQVFCVTHMPQIAAFADRQYNVQKIRGKGETNTRIVSLDGETRVLEICRMLGDSTGRDATLKHARDLLERAREKKQSLL